MIHINGHIIQQNRPVCLSTLCVHEASLPNVRHASVTLLNYLLNELLIYLLHGAQSFLRS